MLTIGAYGRRAAGGLVVGFQSAEHISDLQGVNRLGRVRKRERESER